MDIAKRIALMSHAKRSKVGAVVVKDGNILSFGYNGMPNGFDNCCETDNVTNKEVLHAESNAFTKLMKTSNSSEGASLFVTLSPCFDCAKLIIQCGISEVYFHEYYRNTESLEFLCKAGVKVYNIDDNNNVTQIFPRIII